MIKRLVKSGKLLIDPFYEDGIQPASYDMRLGRKILVSPTKGQKGRFVDLIEEKEHAIKPGQFVSTLTEEKITLPNDICGRFGLRSYFTRKGLISFGGIQVDPSWGGHLNISLLNVGPEPLKLRFRDKIFTIEFHKLETPSKIPYTGEYQDQKDFAEDDKKFITKARTVSLSDIEPLMRDVAQLKDLERARTVSLPDIKPFMMNLKKVMEDLKENHEIFIKVLMKLEEKELAEFLEKEPDLYKVEDLKVRYD